MQWSHALRGRQGIPRKRDRLEQGHLGGLRRVAAAVAKNPTARKIGARIRDLLIKELQADEQLFRDCTEAIGSESADAGPPEHKLRRLRRLFGEVVGADQVEPFDPDEYNCSVAGGLIEAWTSASGDPDTEAASWPRVGAPAGILVHPSDAGIFPPAKEDALQLDPLTTEFDAPETRSSYPSVEVCPYAQAEVDRLVDLGYLTRCPTLPDLERELGPGTKVVSRFGQVIKERAGVTKRRLILDARESGVTPCARKNQRIVLPSVNDLVFDALDLLATDQECEAFILDIADAFWTLPLTRRERRFFVGRLKGVFYAFRRLAQGSRGAPLAWCRFFALVARLTQALFPSTDARFNVYVDDPAAILAGTPATRSMSTAVTVLVWRIINLQLSYRKGQRACSVDWIGFRLVISNVRPLQAVVVSVQPATQKELLEMIGDFWHRNVLTIKEVRKFAGKVSNVARLLLGWRPFLFELWAALAAADRAKSRRVWTRQIRPALAWFRAFLREEEVGICRSFRLNAYREPSDCVSITIDASPFGMGAHLCRNGKPCEYFAVELSADDVAIFEYQIGDSAGQQT